MNSLNLEKAHKLYQESVEVLKKNQHENGGFYASPPGTRYPFIYPRDHSIAILGCISAGLMDQAKLALKFILDAQKPVGEFSQRYDVDGNDASYKELQIDGNGLVLYALGQYYNASEKYHKDGLKDNSFIKQYWDTIVKAVEFIISNKNSEVNLIHTINSIHEYPAYEHGFEIYANATCCAGLYSAIEMGEVLGKDISGWRKEADEIKSAILKRLYSPRRRSFIKCIRVKDKSSKPIGYDSFASNVIDVDVVEHSPAYFGLIDENDMKNISTVKRIHENLWDKEIGGMNRYPELWNRNNGGYGPWCHFTGEMASHYIAVDNRDMAELYLSWLVDIAHDYKLPEHVSTIERFELWLEDYTNSKILRNSKLEMIKQAKEHPKWQDGLAYITFPLIWAHAEYIRAYNKYINKYF
ncbi:glycoside hydrolase family 15 protein [Methanosalsum natronophilum]|uniref:glycoside hydrolase family 15 protein n=1 Tax=Methanosalsum natronophilum TaxID=768733 RepID=UPI0035B66045